jgi:hypothetical protein
LFGRPARDSGFASERGTAPSAAQKLHLLNSSHLRDNIEASVTAAPDTPSRRRGPGKRQSASLLPSTEKITALYLRVLSRYPTDGELDVIGQYGASAEAEGQEILADLTWALINTPEFLYRH